MRRWLASGNMADTTFWSARTSLGDRERHFANITGITSRNVEQASRTVSAKRWNESISISFRGSIPGDVNPKVRTLLAILQRIKRDQCITIMSSPYAYGHYSILSFWPMHSAVCFLFLYPLFNLKTDSDNPQFCRRLNMTKADPYFSSLLKIFYTPKFLFCRIILPLV